MTNREQNQCFDINVETPVTTRNAQMEAEAAIEVPLDNLIALYQQVEILAAKLGSARRTFAEPSGDGGRWAAQRALHAVIEFIQTSPEMRGAGFDLPLGNLLAALFELDDGIIRPILKRRPPGRGGQRDRQRDRFFATALAIADIMPPAELANKLTGAGYGEISAETLRQWRRDLKKLRHNDYRRERYDNLAKELVGAPAGRAEKLLLTLIARLPPHVLTAPDS